MASAIVTPAMQAKAERLAEMVPTLSRGRSKVNGVGFYIFPASTPGVAHWSNGLGCTCEGHRRRGTCTHALAVTIHRQRAEAPIIAAAQPAPAKSAQEIAAELLAQFGPCVSRGCSRPADGKGRRCTEHRKRLLDQLAS